MKRRRSREYALQVLFQLDLTGNELNNDMLNEFWQGIDEGSDVKKFSFDIIKNTRQNISKIDDTIKQAAEHWALNRMAIIDRNILRAATYELLFRSDIPASVVINEAIEIAKKYSTEESAPFINGILDKIAHATPVSGDNGHKELK